MASTVAYSRARKSADAPSGVTRLRGDATVALGESAGTRGESKSLLGIRLPAWNRQPNRAHFSSYGIWTVHTWVLLTLLGGEQNPSIPWLNAYGALTLALLVLVFGRMVIIRRASVNRRSDAKAAGMAYRVADVVVPALEAIATLVYTDPLAISPPTTASAISILAIGAGIAWLYLRWGFFFGRLETKRAVRCLLSANILGSFAKALLVLLPAPVPVVIAAVLPAASTVFLWRAMREERPSMPNRVIYGVGMGGYASLWRLVICVAAFSFVCTVADKSLASPAFVGAVVPPWISAIGHLIEIGIAATILWIVYVRGGSFGFVQLWCIIFFFSAASLAFFACAVPYHAELALQLMRLAVNLIVMYFWMALADISHHGTDDPYVVFGVGWTIYAAMRFLGSLVVDTEMCGISTDAGAMLALFALSAAIVLCLATRNSDMLRIFSDLDDTPSVIDGHSGLDKSIAEIAAAHGLTERETEVMSLLCRGRSKAYIAESLSIAENTVGSHAKHIYAKLDVHSKEELMNLVLQ